MSVIYASFSVIFMVILLPSAVFKTKPVRNLYYYFQILILKTFLLYNVNIMFTFVLNNKSIT